MLYALLRGEEKGPNGKGNPADEIRDKMEWTYGTSIPYILGYFATEYFLNFCSLGVQIIQRKVAKTYSEARVYARVKNLYAELNQFPGSEVMIHSNDEERTLVFKRGYSVKPRTMAELQGCLRDVCDTLV